MTMMTRRAVVMVALLAAACGGTTDNDPNTIAWSEPVSVRLDKFKDDEVRNGAFNSDKSITSESGNPYGQFLQTARARLGRDPAAVLIDGATITLGADTRGVTAFEQIFAGPVTLYVVGSNDTTVNVGTIALPTGPGPVAATITAGRAELAAVNREMLSGGFKVGMRVPAAAMLPRSFDAKVTLTVTFRALIN